MIFCIVLIALSILSDQVSKYLVSTGMEVGETIALIENVFHFTYVQNRGAAFGMLADHRWVFMVLSVLGIGAMIVWLVHEKPKSRWLQAALSLVIGGGIGNMIDRIVLGYVVDFIDCRFIDFYVFNIADSCVCVGCGMFVLAVILEEVRSVKAKKEQTPEEEQSGDETVGEQNGNE
ncbi:MAG: signal peptidase II [Clostridia bacterium]|nr:signal peptidase II [Clostridia bacterium]